MQSEQTQDELMTKLREVETLASSSEQWVHCKGWNDIKTTFNDALAICEELRSNAKLAKHSETKELPGFVKAYIGEKIQRIQQRLNG